MSTIHVEVCRIESIVPHENADRLEVAGVMGTHCCVGKGTFTVGEPVFWFPPDILLPEEWAKKLGVENYLKAAQYPGNTEQTKCKVAATRLRGIPSYGFIAPLTAHNEGRTCVIEGEDHSHLFGAVKYEPPVKGDPSVPRRKGFNADAAADNIRFHRYTDIQHWYKYSRVFNEGEEVVITEKIHGSNIRFGLVRNDQGEFEFMCGSHKVNWKEGDNVWWGNFDEKIAELLTALCDEQHDVIVFGELHGPGVQDMDYGLADKSVRIFDIAVDGGYLHWDVVKWYAEYYGVPMVPVIYEGPVDREVVERLTNGETLAAGLTPKSKFKGREGVVIKPKIERWDHRLGRVITKSVSADYLDRKGALDLSDAA